MAKYEVEWINNTGFVYTKYDATFCGCVKRRTGKKYEMPCKHYGNDFAIDNHCKMIDECVGPDECGMHSPVK